MLLLGLLLPVAAAIQLVRNPSICAKYGDGYGLVTSIGIIELRVQRNALCVAKCPPVRQIQNLDSEPTAAAISITTARCGLQSTASGHGATLACTYHNATGHEVVVAHSFPLFREWVTDEPRCVLLGSLITKYSMHSIWFYLKVGSVVLAVSLCLLICGLGCCCAWCCCR